MLSLYFLISQTTDPMLSLFDAVVKRDRVGISKSLEYISRRNQASILRTPSDVLLFDSASVHFNPDSNDRDREIVAYGHPTEKQIQDFRYELIQKSKVLFPECRVTVSVNTDPKYGASECESIEIREQMQQLETGNLIQMSVNYRTRSIYEFYAIWKWKPVAESLNIQNSPLLETVKQEGDYDSMTIGHLWAAWTLIYGDKNPYEERQRRQDMRLRLSDDQLRAFNREEIQRKKQNPHYGELNLVTEIKVKRGPYTDTYWFNQQGEEVPFYPDPFGPPTSRKTPKIIKPD